MLKIFNKFVIKLLLNFYINDKIALIKIIQKARPEDLFNITIKYSRGEIYGIKVDKWRARNN